MYRPVHQMLTKAATRLSGHMPGHMGRDPFGPADLTALDTTELPVTDDLYAPEGALLEAQQLYAASAGAGASLFLHNGSTQGIHAMLMLWARPGDTVLLPRNAHLSAANACVLGGLRPVWMPVTARPDGSVIVTEDTVLAALQAHPEAKVLLLTRPDYFGCCLPLSRIAAEAHARGIRLAVDEAHGAHFPWLTGIQSAGALGADAWVQSVHKTLFGLTGSAVLHLRRAEDRDAALRIVRRQQTSSPSFLLMRSIDDSRAWMDAYGIKALSALTDAVDRLRALLPQLGYADAQTPWRQAGYDCDPTRLVIDAPQGGHALAEALAQRGVDCEMADTYRVLLLFGAGADPAHVDRVGQVLRKIPAGAPIPRAPVQLTDLPPQVMDIRGAAMGDTEAVPLELCRGRTAAISAGIYPPGIPMVVPGEEINDTICRSLQAAAPRSRFGTEGETILCVKQ